MHFSAKRGLAIACRLFVTLLQYVAYDEIGHFLCSVISQGKVVALDR